MLIQKKQLKKLVRYFEMEGIYIFEDKEKIDWKELKKKVKEQE